MLHFRGGDAAARVWSIQESLVFAATVAAFLQKMPSLQHHNFNCRRANSCLTRVYH
jgi:hypothetical protein